MQPYGEYEHGGCLICGGSTVGVAFLYTCIYMYIFARAEAATVFTATGSLT